MTLFAYHSACHLLHCQTDSERPNLLPDRACFAGRPTAYLALPFCRRSLTCANPGPYGYPGIPKTLGQHIRKRRLDTGLYQADLAQKLGVDNQTIRNWESSRTSPTARHMPQILAFLGYNPTPVPDNLAERLNQYRQINGLSQRQLAAQLGVDPSSILAWETDEHRPTGRSIDLLNGILPVAK